MFNEGYHLDWGNREFPFIINFPYLIALFYPTSKRIDQKYFQITYLIMFLAKLVFSKSASRFCLYTNLISIVFLFKKATI